MWFFISFITVIDIDIDGHTAVAGLMFKEMSEDIWIHQGGHYITVYNDHDEKILEDGIMITEDKKYLGIIAGSMNEPENLPTLFMVEDAPIL